MEAGDFFRRWDRKSNAQHHGDSGSARATEPMPAPALDSPDNRVTVAKNGAAGIAEANDAAVIRADVDPDVRRAALKQLFADPHFRKSDGLDVYMDDYNAVAPLSAAMLANLDHAASLVKPVNSPPENERDAHRATMAAAGRPGTSASIPSEPVWQVEDPGARSASGRPDGSRETP